MKKMVPKNHARTFLLCFEKDFFTLYLGGPETGNPVPSS